jgi:hypothetical protein
MANPQQTMLDRQDGSCSSIFPLEPLFVEETPGGSRVIEDWQGQY